MAGALASWYATNPQSIKIMTLVGQYAKRAEILLCPP